MLLLEPHVVFVRLIRSHHFHQLACLVLVAIVLYHRENRLGPTLDICLYLLLLLSRIEYFHESISKIETDPVGHSQSMSSSAQAQSDRSAHWKSESPQTSLDTLLTVV